MFKKMNHSKTLSKQDSNFRRIMHSLSFKTMLFKCYILKLILIIIFEQCCLALSNQPPPTQQQHRMSTRTVKIKYGIVRGMLVNAATANNPQPVEVFLGMLNYYLFLTEFNLNLF